MWPQGRPQAGFSLGARQVPMHSPDTHGPHLAQVPKDITSSLACPGDREKMGRGDAGNGGTGCSVGSDAPGAAPPAQMLLVGSQLLLFC